MTAGISGIGQVASLKFDPEKSFYRPQGILTDSVATPNAASRSFDYH